MLTTELKSLQSIQSNKNVLENQGAGVLVWLPSAPVSFSIWWPVITVVTKVLKLMHRHPEDRNSRNVRYSQSVLFHSRAVPTTWTVKFLSRVRVKCL